MLTASIAVDVTIAGTQFNARATREAEGSIAQKPTLPVGQAGVLTRSDANTGVATLGTGHGIETADVVDVYWSGGSRSGMAATVSVNEVTVDGGEGDDLPSSAATPVVVTKQVTVNLDVDGDELVALAFKSSSRAQVHFMTEADASILRVDLAAEEVWLWTDDMGIANPLAGQTIGKLQVSCGSATAAGLLELAGLYDSVA